MEFNNQNPLSRIDPFEIGRKLLGSIFEFFEMKLHANNMGIKYTFHKLQYPITNPVDSKTIYRNTSNKNNNSNSYNIININNNYRFNKELSNVVF